MPGFIGFPELLLLGVVALLLFGPKRLPEMGRGLGKGLREFKDSVSGDHHEPQLELGTIGNLQAQAEAVEPETQKVA
jgi:sec-independent protein translocase protein TatA